MLIKTVLFLTVETCVYELPGRKFQKEFFHLKKQLEVPFRLQPGDYVDFFLEGDSLFMAEPLRVKTVIWVIDKGMAIVRLKNVEVAHPSLLANDLQRVGWKECNYPDEYKWED